MESRYSFKGTYGFKIDNKGRVIIPSKLRKQIMTNDFTVIPSSENHLILYPDDAFRAFEQKLMETLNEEDKTIIKNYIYSSAEDTQADSHGRIKIPANLMKKAGIEDEVLIIGAMDRIELWKPEEFDKNMRTIEEKHKKTLKSIGL